MSKVELKPCPFCGSPVRLNTDYLPPIKFSKEFYQALPNLDEMNKCYWIGCENKDCIFMTRSLNDKDEVIKRYNERV